MIASALNQAKNISAVAAQNALTSLVPSGIDVQQRAANDAPQATQVAMKAESSAVEQSLCSHLQAVFDRSSGKFTDMLIDTVKRHITEDPAVKEHINDTINAALAPRIQAALTETMDRMTSADNPENIYSTLKKKIDVVFDGDIRKSVFDNINVLSKEALEGIVEKLVPQNRRVVESALAPISPEPAPVASTSRDGLSDPTPVSPSSPDETPGAPPSSSLAKGGRPKSRRARARRNRGTRRRQKILMLA